MSGPVSSDRPMPPTDLAGGVARLGTESAFTVLARARELERGGGDARGRDRQFGRDWSGD